MQFANPFSGSYKITSPFGYRTAPTAGATTDHKGVDYSVPVGTDILSTAPGVVSEAAYSASRGNYVIVNHGGGLSSVYEHLDSIAAKIGQTVAQGERIGSSGNTGITTGPNLHFEIRENGVAVDPLKYLSGSTEVSDMGDLKGKALGYAGDAVELLKQYWYIAAGGLILVALIDRFKD